MLRWSVQVNEVIPLPGYTAGCQYVIHTGEAGCHLHCGTLLLRCLSALFLLQMCERMCHRSRARCCNAY